MCLGVLTIDAQSGNVPCNVHKDECKAKEIDDKRTVKISKVYSHKL